VPTLIERQDALVALLLPVHRKFIAAGHSAGGAYAGQRSKVKRPHIEEMRAAGYSQREAAASAQQCDEMAWLTASCDALEQQMATGAA
jgi:hypothetical protein